MSKRSPFWMPGRRMPCTSTSETSPDASTAVGIGHAAGLHFVEQRGALRRRAGIAARAVQAGHQADGLDAHRMHAVRHGQIADQFGCGLFRLRAGSGLCDRIVSPLNQNSR